MLKKVTITTSLFENTRSKLKKQSIKLNTAQNIIIEYLINKYIDVIEKEDLNFFIKTGKFDKSTENLKIQINRLENIINTISENENENNFNEIFDKTIDKTIEVNKSTISDILDTNLL